MKRLSPSFMAECPESGVLLFEKVLEKLCLYKIITQSDADQSKLQYNKLLSNVVKENKEAFADFDNVNDRLDAFLWRVIGGSSRYKNLLGTLKIVLILSHGQAQVERGFSLNS